MLVNILKQLAMKEKFKDEYSEAEKIVAEEGDKEKTWTVTIDTVTPGKDKIAHFVVCMAITLGTFFIGGSFGYAFLGLILALMVGYIKELYDKFIRKTGFNWKDIAWDTFGAFAGLLISAIFYIITH